MNISPCVYPGCDDGNGNPALTTNGMCDHCRRRYRKLLDRIVINYVTIRATMPKPIVTDTGTRSAPRKSREPGHPAQWASDTARAIADVLDGTSDSLRDHLGHLPPPQRARAEGRVVDHAWATLLNRFDDLCTYPGAKDAASEIANANRRAWSGLGNGRTRTHLPAPCPDCGLLTMFRIIGLDRSDAISCDACGRVIRESEYGLYARMIVDDFIATGDTSNTGNIDGAAG